MMSKGKWATLGALAILSAGGISLLAALGPAQAEPVGVAAAEPTAPSVTIATPLLAAPEIADVTTAVDRSAPHQPQAVTVARAPGPLSAAQTAIVQAGSQAGSVGITREAAPRPGGVFQSPAN